MIFKKINRFTNLKVIEATEGTGQDVNIMNSCWKTELTYHYESVRFKIAQIHAIQFCTATYGINLDKNM